MTYQYDQDINVCADCSPDGVADDSDVSHCEICGVRISPHSILFR